MTNTEKLFNFFETDYPLNKDGVKELISLFQHKKVTKKAILLQEGQTESRLRFITKGIVREFYTGSKKDTNINFFTSPQFITDFTSFIYSVSSNKNQECLSDIEILELRKETFLKVLDKYSCGKDFITSAFQKILKEKELFEYNRITKEPEQLYRELLLYKGSWLNQIPQYHIASYLGIAPETLSRIRKRILD